jgi:MFS family permease
LPALEAARRALTSRWALISLSCLAYNLAGQLLRPMLTLRLSELGASDALIGVMVAINPLVAIGFALPAGRFADRVGVSRMQTWGLVAMAAGGVGYAFAASVPALVALQVYGGLAELAGWLGMQAVITHAGSAEERSDHMALFSLLWGCGLAFGPSIGGPVYEHFGFAWLGWAYTGMAALAAAFAALGPRVRPQGRAGGEDDGGMRDALRRVLTHPSVRGVLLATFGCLAIGSLRATYYPLFLEREGISVARIGLLLSVFGIASLLMRVPLPWLLRTFEPTRVLVAGMGVATVAMGLTPLLPGSYPGLAVAAAVAGAGTGLMPPITVELLARSTEGGDRGVAMAARVMTNRAAQFVQPLVFAGVAGLAGLASGFAVTGLLLAALTAWTGVYSRRAGHMIQA